MANAATVEFDLGPLTWVKAEIEQSLAKGVASLTKFAEHPDEQTQLKHAQTHIHQAAGAVQIVGLDGAITLLEEIERHLALLEAEPPAAVGTHVEAIGAACRRLTRYLNELTEGEPPVTLKLYAEYEALTRLRGSDTASPTDLFYPDLSRRPPASPRPAAPIAANQMPAFMRTQRRVYQQGLLTWLRGDPEGLAAMQRAVRAIEDGLAGTLTASFWWSVSAFLESTASQGILPSYTVKQLCARIDLQIRRFVEGSTKVADRLRREVLYHVAISEPVTARIRAVQDHYGLPAMLPQRVEARQVDIDRFQPILSRAQELINAAKEQWLKVTGGRRELIGSVAQILGELKTLIGGLHEPALSDLVGALESVSSESARTGTIPDVLAMEFATGVLLTEDAVGHFARLSEQFPKQVLAMRRRLDYAQRGVLSLPTAEEDLLDETARRAHERMLLAQVAREIQSNLRHVEKVLDGFFRDSSERGELAGLSAYTRQIQGALRMLGLTDADALLDECQRKIDSYAEGAVVNNDELEALAESLSGLGFYIEAVEQQRPDALRLLEPFMRRAVEEAAAPAEAPAQSIEATIQAARESLPAVLERFRASPRDPALHAELNNTLQSLKHDADLVGDAQFSGAAARALAALDDPRLPASELLHRLDELVPAPSASAPAPSAETMRLLGAGEETLDAELAEIFLTEAHEVLANVSQHRLRCEADPADREALRAIRRGFHTLKGSGRMVGLADLGEAAYTVEKVMNRWLEEERLADPEVIVLIREAERGFTRWIGDLQKSGAVHVDDSAIRAAVAALEAAFPSPGHPYVPPVAEQGTPVAEKPLAQPPAAEERIAEQPVAEVPIFKVPAFEVPFFEPPVSTQPVSEQPVVDEPLIQDWVAKEPVFEQPAVDQPFVEQPLADQPVADQQAAEPTAVPEYELRIERPAELPTASLSLDWEDLKAPAVSSAPSEPSRHVHLEVKPELVRTRAREADEAHEAQSASTHLGEQIAVGDTVMSASLYAILLEETSELLDTLRREHSVLEFDPQARPSDEMVRAAHTLTGIHRTAGFPPVAETAEALESALLTLQHQPRRPESMLPALADAAQALAELVDFIGMRKPFAASALDHAAASRARLHQLHESGGGFAADSETLAAQAALADEQPATIATLEPALGAPANEPVAAKARVAMLPAAADAVAEPIASVSEALASVRDDLDPQLLPVFIEEAQELFPRAGALLRDWRRAPSDQSAPRELRRTLHTLKGSARMAGAMRLGELTHLMESRLLVGDRAVAPSAELFDALDSDLDHLAALIDELQSRPAVPAEAAAQPVGDAMPATAAATSPPSPGRAAADDQTADVEVRERATIRVRTDVVDRLVNETGEVAIARARVEGELRALKANLLELTNSVIRLRGQVREIEIQAETQIQSRMSQVHEADEGFDPLEFDRYTRFQELSRSLAEGVNDVATVQQSLLKNLDDADAALMAQARLSRDVQQQLLAVRTVPFSSMSERLYRLLRQTAKELDKKANLEIKGGHTELDRGVLEKLVAPLEHLLRNALDHGIESRDERIAAGKTEIGEVAISVRQEGNEIALTLTDDGRGLPLAAIRDKAVASGIIAADAAPTQSQLIDAIFAPGFTTAHEVTQISGRGIGMDVVKNEITSLGGRVEVATTTGRGTTFTLYLPLTLAVTQAVLVRTAGRIYALPAVLVEQVQQVKPDALTKVYAAREVRWQARRYPFHDLAQLLGNERPAPEFQRYNPVLILKSANQSVAIHVEEMLGNQEIVIKNIGLQLSRLPGLAGATVLGTGEIVLILNPVQLAARYAQLAKPVDQPGALQVVGEDGALTPVAGSAHARAPYVLIVDDSLTVRKITSRLLVREGYEAGTARDGVDALQVLADRTPDVILLDIEMPRMDGFEFAKTVKADPKLTRIPIIMITSRTAEKHRARAAEIGVEVYLGKPYQEEELLKQVRLAVDGQLGKRPAALLA